MGQMTEDTADLFLPTAGTGHQMVSVQKDAVDILAHLAIVAILLDGALLHPPPTRNPVLGTQCQDTLGLLGGQLHVTGATQHRAHPRLLSTLFAGDQVAAVKDDSGVHVHLIGCS